MESKAAKLRRLISKKGIVQVMGAHNGLSAKLAESAGFDAIWASGLEVSTANCVPDANILTMTDFLNVASSMNEVVAIPVIADCDTGFGNSNNVIHMVKKYEAAGIAAVCIEDKLFPKVNSFVPGRQELASISEFVGKILAAKNAQIDKNFMVIARVEALIANWGMEEALKRANAYVDAGADAILIHSKRDTPVEIEGFSRDWKGRAPLVVVPTTYYNITADRFRKMNVSMVIYANHGIRAEIRAMEDVFRQIHKDGSTQAVEGKIASMKEVFEIQGMPKMKENELIYSASDKDKIAAIIPAAGDHLEELSMKDISRDIPISMLDINGKPLLQRQVEMLNRCKVYNIRVVAGYKREKIKLEGIKVVENHLYKETGILYSIMQAMEGLDQRVFISYGDVLFDHIILNSLLESPKDITIIVDRAYDKREYGPERKIDFVYAPGEARHTKRLLHADSLKLVKKISSNFGKGDGWFEFPGMTFLSNTGARIFKEVYKKNKKKFKRSGLGELLNEIIKEGFEVYCIESNSGWMEINSLKDYKIACSLVK